MIRLIALLIIFLLISFTRQDSLEVENARREAVNKCKDQKNTRWCARLKRCVRPCEKCLEPIIIGNDYLCGPRTCRTWEKCINQKVCRGRIFGRKYEYLPSDRDPCSEQIFY